jgi:hypothetical protein
VFDGSARKQVPPLRIAIDKANRNAPVGMTDWKPALLKAFGPIGNQGSFQRRDFP